MSNPELKPWPRVTEEMVEAAMAVPVVGPRQKYIRNILESALSLLPTAEVSGVGVKEECSEASEWHRADGGNGDVLLYTLRQDGWRKGQPVLVNDVTIRVERAARSETDIGPIVNRILSSLSPSPVGRTQE